MGQELDNERRLTNEETADNLPEGDGGVSDEAIQAVKGENDDGPIGQDHSTDHHERQMPESGVGAIQSQNDTRSDIARIDDEE